MQGVKRLIESRCEGEEKKKKDIKGEKTRKKKEE